jgi:NADPH:quinone reductase-like Zn-dependent oxidoreductase
MAWAHEGKVRPLVDKTYALEQHGEAFNYLVSRQAKGKIVFKL